MFPSEWREFPSAPCIARGGGDLMTARVSMLLKSRVPDMLPSLYHSWTYQHPGTCVPRVVTLRISEFYPRSVFVCSVCYIIIIVTWFTVRQVRMRFENDVSFQASATQQMRTALFWAITQRVVAISYQSSGATYRPCKSNETPTCAGFISAESLYMFRAQAPIIRSI